MLIHLAEDDAGLRELLTTYLEGQGHEIRAAENGAELVKHSLAKRPDLLITDLHMPEVAGNSIIDMLNMYPGLGGIPVIVISGVAQAELEDMGIPRDITILPKPFDFDKIYAALIHVQAGLDRQGRLASARNWHS